MRVLVVDQDSASNEAISRSLRELFTVDAVTNKGDCLDLLRSNTFEVIVATERLEDGSGLELLGQIAKKYPGVLRIFAADRQRLKLLKGRLGPFELFQTLTYPIDPDRLIASLNLAEAAQEAHADTSNIQHVVLTSESPPEEVDEFPAPQPLPRAATVGHSQGGSNTSRATSRAAPHRTRSSSPSSSTSARPLRHRGRASGRHPPVRFPSQQSAAPFDAPQPLDASRSRGVSHPLGAAQDFRSNDSASDSLNDAVAIARAARSDFDSSASSDGPNVQRLAIRAGIGAAAGLILVLLGFKLSSKSEAPHPAVVTVSRAPVIEAPPPLPAPEVAPPKTASKSTTARSGSKRSRRSEAAANGAATPLITPLATTSTPRTVPASVVSQAPAVVPAGTPADDGPVLPPETPPGLTRAVPAINSAGASHNVATAVSAASAPDSRAIPPVAAAPMADASAASNRAAVTPAAAARAQTSPSSASTHLRSLSEPPPVIKEAKLIRRVDPDYPSAAKRDGVTGSVELEVTVSPQGSVESVSVAHSNPPDLFEKSAVAAVRKWKYDPRFVDGLPTEAHLKVHLEFGPDR